MTTPIMPDAELETKILSLWKLVDGHAHFSYVDPLTLSGYSVILDDRDFRRLGAPGFLRVSVQVVEPFTAFAELQR